MDAKEGREKKRVHLADDPSNRAMVQMDLHLLPPEVRLEILSRLPITSLIQFKTTSHTGYDLITDPRLPPMFRNQVSDSNPCLILYDSQFAVPWQLYFVDSEGCSRRVRKIDLPQHSDVNVLAGSCNGLLCLFGRASKSHSLLIYNPFVGDAVRVPPANRFRQQREVFGFGFHPKTGEFKVVRIVHYLKKMTVADPVLMVEADPVLMVEEVNEGSATVLESMVQVLTVGTTEWRNQGATPPQLAAVMEPPEVLVEGSLHWVTTVGMGGVSHIFGIISFELADEMFQELPHPPCQQLVSQGYSLSVLNGCLSAAGVVDTVHFDIWVMKQYRFKESWVKQFSFVPPSSFVPNYLNGWLSSRSYPVVLCALKNGEILLQYDVTSLVSYDPVENSVKTLQMSGLPRDFLALPFLPSLFSAKATMNLQL